MYRVLIADDETIERKVIYRTLEKELGEQCQILQAENGRQAVALFDEHDIQIAILDIEMPGMNGIQAAQEMRKRKKNCCIIFLTAYDDFAYAKEAISIRVLDYLLKPFKEQELIQVVEEAMRLMDKEGFAEQEILCPEREYSMGDGQKKYQKVAEVIQDYLEKNYVRDLSMQEVASAMNYSDAYFCKLFKQCFGKNFTTYLTEYRIEEAKKLLESPTVNVKETGEAVGYCDPNYFAKVFRRVTGVSPTEYRMCIFDKK